MLSNIYGFFLIGKEVNTVLDVNNNNNIIGSFIMYYYYTSEY